MTSGIIRIEKACQKHLEAASRLAVTAWTPVQQNIRRKIGSELDQVFFPDWQSARSQTVKKELGKGRGYVASAGDRLVGFISYELDDDKKTARLGCQAVQDDWCGQDISDLLHKHVCACLKRKGVVYLRLSSGLDDGYGPIRRAYARAGFKLALPSISYYQKINHFTLEPPGRLLIARAEKKHLAAACAITSLAWSGIYAEYANLLGPDLHDRFFAGWEAKKHQAVSQELSGPRAYVAVLEDKLVGFISYTLVEAGSYAVIGHNAVHSSWRGQGIGGQLYKHVLNCMLKEGVAYAKVTTGLDVAHAPARRAYAKAGFLHGLSSSTYLRKLEG